MIVYSKLTSVFEQEMTIYEEKIRNLEKEKERIWLKAQELKNKLGPRLDNLITQWVKISKATIQEERSPE